MAKARKLPSGSWRCLVYDHSEEIFGADGQPIIDAKTGKQKKKRIYTSFTNDDPSPAGRRAAEAAAADYVLNKKDKQSDGFQLLGDTLDEYISLRTSVLSPATIREYKRSRNKDMQGLMDKNIYDITQEMIQKEMNREAVTHSPKSVRNMHGLLSAVLREKRPDFAINTKLPQKRRPNLYIPTDEDVEKIMLVAKNTDMEIPILLAAFGPMRRGEICGLHYENIKGNRVHVYWNMVLDENKKFVLKAPKTYAGDRYIDFPNFVADKLTGREGMVTKLNPNMITSRFFHILKKAGVPHFRFHDLRHYCASIQHALGIPDAYIMERGGWGNDSVLKSVYRHTLQDKSVTMTDITNKHFEDIMQHEMQHENKKPPK